MLFNSYTFIVFLAITAAAFWACPRWSQKKFLLLVASYAFYAAWNPPYIFLLFFCTVLDWSLARAIVRVKSPDNRRWLLIVSLISNLGLLGYFKYGNFLGSNFSTACSLLGLSYHAGQADILLPIGISFYTFASLSYTIDVYRGEIDGRTKFIDYALFVSFFPHLVAGPIVRARLLLPQIESPRSPGINEVGWGLAMVCMGLFCKVVLADAILTPVVDSVYARPELAGSLNFWLAVLGFSGQIYYDFSGYSLCAIGLAMCFGFAFPDNFHYPYGALSFSDFWRRWHITLSTWLRDYLYIPLGGNRHGRLRMYVALGATMLLGGLWHGASWMFVLWGTLHGAYLIVERMGGKVFEPKPESGQVRAAIIFLVVSLTWIPFRSSTPDIAWSIARGLFAGNQNNSFGMPEALVLVLMLATVRWHFMMRRDWVEAYFERLGTKTKILCLSIMLIALFLVSGGNSNAFLYFQF